MKALEPPRYCAEINARIARMPVASSTGLLAIAP
jgi:hypothetical protein